MIIVIASAKGGSGKTTTAMHLGAWLASRYSNAKRVIALYDADPNQDCFSWYQQGTADYPQQFDCIAQDESFDVADYEHVVIDSAGGRDEDLIELMEHSDFLIVPSRPAMLDLKNAIATLEHLNLPADKAKLLLTFCDARRHTTTQQAFNYLESREVPHSDVYLLQRAIIEDAPAFGATVDQLKGKVAKQAWQDYSDAFTDILGVRL